MAEMTKSILDEPNTKANGTPESSQANEEGIVAWVESIETRTNVMRLAISENLSSVILEPMPGRSWQFSRAGCLIGRDQETAVVEAKCKGTAYAICIPNEDGYWHCSIIDFDVILKTIQARL